MTSSIVPGHNDFGLTVAARSNARCETFCFAAPRQPHRGQIAQS
jgi:hypothetical protein